MLHGDVGRALRAAGDALIGSLRLSDEEFADARTPFLAFGAPGPTADELAGLGHIEKLAEFLDQGRITEEDFAAQKRAILGGRAAAMAKPVSAWNDLDEP